MEKFDLSSFYNQILNKTSAAKSEDIDSQVNAYNQEINEKPRILWADWGDNGNIGGKDINSYGSENIENNETTAGEKKTILDFAIYKNIKKGLKHVKELILKLHKGTNPNNPNPADPNDPNNPNNPDPVDPNNPNNPDPDNPNPNNPDPNNPDPNNPDPNNPDPNNPDPNNPNPNNPTPDENDGTDGNGPTEQKPSAKTLHRGDPVYSTNISGTETVITLANPFGGKDYQYTIKSTDGTTISNVTFEFLKNGRLVITGDKLDIKASNNQKDSIILMGNYCELDTGDGDDHIRIGGAFDDDGYYEMSNNYQTLDLMGGYTAKVAQHNNIKAGSGNDYVYLVGVDNNIDGSTGNDKVKTYIGYTMVKNTLNNVELSIDGANHLTGLDYLDGWVCQGDEGDCRYLSLINSVCHNTNTGNLNKYMKVTDKGSSYEVEFLNYPVKTGTKNNKIEVSKSELNSYTGVNGDLDTILIDLALNKIIARNMDRYEIVTTEDVTGDGIPDYVERDNSVQSAYYNTIAKYMFGNEDITVISDVSSQRSQFLELWNKYQSGEIANLTIGIHEPSNNGKLGIIRGHAYSVKNVVTGTSDDYVEIVNPWDDGDSLKLSLNDFFSLDVAAIVYGADIYNQGILMPNGGMPRRLNNSNETPSTGIGSMVYIGSTGAETQILNEVNDVKEKINNIKSLISKNTSRSIEIIS